MKASELIEALKVAIAEHGDRRIFAYSPDESWHEVCRVDRFDDDDEPDARDDAYAAGDFNL